MVFRKTPRPDGRGVFAFLALFLLWSNFATADVFCALDQLPTGMAQHKVRVSSVSDGDTIRLLDGRRVRLIGINAPELNAGGRGAEPYARQAKKAVQGFLAGSDRAVLVIGKEAKDSYGRVLGHVFNTSGESLESHMLAAGLAWHVVVPPNVSLADCLADAQQNARSQRLGVWTLSPVQAKAIKHGGFQRVRGRVGKVTLGKTWWLNFEGGLAAVVYPENQKYFSKAWLRGLEGKTIELQGWVYATPKGQKPWRMKLETRHGAFLE